MRKTRAVVNEFSVLNFKESFARKVSHNSAGSFGFGFDFGSGVGLGSGVGVGVDFGRHSWVRGVKSKTKWCWNVTAGS